MFVDSFVPYEDSFYCSSLILKELFFLKEEVFQIQAVNDIQFFDSFMKYKNIWFPVRFFIIQDSLPIAACSPSISSCLQFVTFLQKEISNNLFLINFGCKSRILTKLLQKVKG